MADYQSDDALNAPALPASPALRSPRQPVSPSPWARGARATQAFPPPNPGARTPTVPASAFAVPGLHGFTRQSWAARKVALITGITGQDGSYLAELLLDKGYQVHGIIRRSSSFNTSRLHHLFSEARVERLALHYGDLTDSTNLVHIISQVQPSEVYNLGAQSHVKVSFEMAEYTANVDGTGALRLLDAIRTCGLDHLVKFYQASTSELYGQAVACPQDESTPFHPRSPYGVAKLYAYWITVNYRESYSMFASNGILFNHESPRRGRTFVTRKISRAVAEISLGRQECMVMGNLDALRDWGHARDYVEGMWRVLQHSTPDDFVLASGESHTVREFIEAAFGVIGRRITWSGVGVDEVGTDDAGRVVVGVDARYFRPAEVDRLQGDAGKARRLLGWAPTVGFADLVREMVEADVASAKYLIEDLN
ncbi:hypothetical protein Q8F55_001960 [Vanrija albida]|uniref:GDP-mannose 4,6-dehydratase n=1 Tax=Vanrija albida TaxID=181172 RepID=A0ABR3Q8E3_9TREE